MDQGFGRIKDALLLAAPRRGGARSLFWRQMLAEIFDKRVVTLETQEGSAYGAALLSMVGTGAYATVPEVCATAIREVDSIAPRPEEAVPYARQHQLFQSLYPALKPFFAEVASAEAASSGHA